MRCRRTVARPRLVTLGFVAGVQQTLSPWSRWSRVRQVPGPWLLARGTVGAYSATECVIDWISILEEIVDESIFQNRPAERRPRGIWADERRPFRQLDLLLRCRLSL